VGQRDGTLSRRHLPVPALAERDFGLLFRLLARYAGASQTQLAIAVGMTQGQISTIMAGTRRITAIEVIERVLDGLSVPDPARMTLGLAPRPGYGHGDRENEEVDRRKVVRLGGTLALAGAAAGGRLPGAELTRLAQVLTSYHASPSPTATECTIQELILAVALAKRNYQACRYAAVLTQLPGLLDDLRRRTASEDGDQLLRAHALAADAYQIAGSVTHALIGGGHAGRARELATQTARQLAAGTRGADAEALSVYGALVLRGAIAAAELHDRAGAAELLDEAGATAQRLGRDDNAHGTAFGPTNVRQHRVHIAVLLGDAGTALELAHQVDVRRIPVAERRATFFIDVAAAYTQWDRYEPAYEALRTAERVASEEVRANRTVHRLVADPSVRAPHSMRRGVREFAQTIGVAR
jgi:transcriptional regulator with XRE-family HTH domain